MLQMLATKPVKVTFADIRTMNSHSTTAWTGRNSRREGLDAGSPEFFKDRALVRFSQPDSDFGFQRVDRSA